MKLNLKEGRKLAATRVRVINKVTKETGNLVDWLNNGNCRVFTHYDEIGVCKLPIFVNWRKEDTELESKPLIEIL